MSAHWPQSKQARLNLCEIQALKTFILGKRTVRERYFCQNLTGGNPNELNTVYKPWLFQCLNLSQTGQRVCTEASRGNVCVCVVMCPWRNTGSEEVLAGWEVWDCHTQFQRGNEVLQTGQGGVSGGCHHQWHCSVLSTSLPPHTWSIFQSDWA